MMKAIKISFLFYAVVLLLNTSCNPTEDISEKMPVVTTGTISNVTNSTATCEGSIIYKGSDVIIARGVCWDATPYPSIKKSITTDSIGTGSFVGSLTDLLHATTYYVCAYATTANGTWYGNVLQITTEADASLPNPILNPELSYDSITDIDGNVYHTISIGSQTWIAENLRVTKYRNGEAIPNVTDNSKWSALKTGAFCNYNNNTELNSIARFGRLYNFYAVTDARNIAPVGWHVASDAEWSTLTTYIASNLGVADSTAQALAATSNWTVSTFVGTIGCLDQGTSINNTSGFSALPAGARFNYGVCANVGDYTGWWTATQTDNRNAWFRSLNYYGKVLNRNSFVKQNGLSIRCIKDL